MVVAGWSRIAVVRAFCSAGTVDRSAAPLSATTGRPATTLAATRNGIDATVVLRRTVDLIGDAVSIPVYLRIAHIGGGH
jgi:hypothetical protein